LGSKKSQVTLFIIIGLVLIVSIGAFIYIKSISVSTDKPLEIIREEAPQDFKPVQSYVIQCVEELTKEAFTIIGKNGGYINLEDHDYTGSAINIDPTYPTESEALVISDAQKIPYFCKQLR